MIIHGGLKAILLYVVNAAVEQYVIHGIEFSPVSTIASALVSTGTWMFLVPGTCTSINCTSPLSSTALYR